MRLVILLLINLPALTLAASNSHHGPEGIPYKIIITQTINIALALGILIYFTRKKVADHFQVRHEGYHAEVRKAEEAKDAAEKKKREISERLKKLQDTQSNTINQARAEAEEMKRKIIDDAKMAAKKLAEDAKRTYEYEYQKAIELLRKELLSSSIQMAEEKMKDEIDGKVLQRMRSEFVEKIRVVQG
ncbi:MAG: ATP synthase F0 subunit B [Bdellovibrionaceae bacterium]|nr:ATP synthase F0 subunit B [Pseudobdellovibrionaceae bacterium]